MPTQIPGDQIEINNLNIHKPTSMVGMDIRHKYSKMQC